MAEDSQRSTVWTVGHGPLPLPPSLVPPLPFSSWGLSTGDYPSFLSFACRPVCVHYLGLGTARLPQTLTGHLNCLVCTGKLCRFHQSLLSSLAVGVRDTNQIRCLRRHEEQWRG